MNEIIAKLVAKQANLAKTLSRARTEELLAEQGLQEARVFRARCEGAKDDVDQTLNLLLEARDSATTPPAGSAAPEGARKAVA